MEVRILGPLEVTGERGALSLPGGRARALLAILGVHGGQVVSIDRLIDDLWGAAPPVTARAKLHGLVSSLRKAAQQNDGDQRLIDTRSPGYALALPPDAVDAIRFRAMVDRARELPPAEQASLLSEALSLWRGPALANFTYEPFAQTEIAALEELRLGAAEARIGAELELGHHAAVVGELELLIAEHPFRERLRALAMLVFYRLGDQRRALGVYRDAAQILGEELGIDPGPDLRDIYQAILDHDPSLQIPDPGPATTASANDPPLAPLLAESRRDVTVVFVGGGGAGDRDADPETALTITRQVQAIANQALHRHGGTVEGTVGGVVVAVFGVPVAHEDDARRAVAAADEIVERTAEIGGRPGVAPGIRIGINTGEVVAGPPPVTGGGYAGSTVRLAARLQQAAGPGDILIGDETRRLVRNLVHVEPVAPLLGDEGGRLMAWRVVSVDAPAGPESPATPLVGRTDELATLDRALRTASKTRRPLRVVISGEAGIGKSRLAGEFVAGLDGRARHLTGHCPPYGDGITFWPLREIVEGAAGGVERERIARILPAADAGPVAAALAGAIGSEEAGRPDVLYRAIRSFFESLCLDRPLVAVIEDLHWSQPTFVDLVEYLADSVEGALMLLCLARPEFLDERPQWATGAPKRWALTLEPLPPEQVGELVKLELASTSVPYERAQQVVELAGGNPLFVEQMMAALRESDEATIPPSIRALLAARLDRLGPAEQSLVRAASVWGRRFRVAEVAGLLPDAARPGIATHLEALERKRLLVRSNGHFDFRHALIRLAAYQSVTKESRAQLHEQVVEVLERSADGDLGDFDELVGYHLEQAVAYRTDLSLDDEHCGRLARRAGEHLGRAGVLAFRRLDIVAAENLLVRANQLLPAGHPDGFTTRRYLAESHQVMAKQTEAVMLLDELINDAGEDADPTLHHFLRVERVWARLISGPDPITLAELQAETARARRVFEGAGDDLGLAQVERVLVDIHRRRGDAQAMEAAATRSLGHAERSGSPREAVAGPWMMALALEEGPRSVPEAVDRCRELMGDGNNPGVAASLAFLLAMTGDFEQARQLIADARRILRETVRARRPVAHIVLRAGHVGLLAGDIESAEALLRDALRRNTEQREPEQVSVIAAELARLLLRQGRVDEAEPLARTSREEAPVESVGSQMAWRTACALLLARSGAHESAEVLAAEAMDMAPSGFLNLSADAAAVRAEVLGLAGHRRRSIEAAEAAHRLYEQKGNLMGAAFARSLTN